MFTPFTLKKFGKMYTSKQHGGKRGNAKIQSAVCYKTFILTGRYQSFKIVIIAKYIHCAASHNLNIMTTYFGSSHWRTVSTEHNSGQFDIQKCLFFSFLLYVSRTCVWARWKKKKTCVPLHKATHDLSHFDMGKNAILFSFLSS